MAITFCVVEDSLEFRESLVRFLQEASEFRCLGAYTSGEEAVLEVPRLKPEVVLMDINLPGMSGIECVRKLKASAPALPIMMFTVYENSDQVFEALSAGACGYLVKNTEPEKLLEAIHDLHRGGSPMSSHIARKVVLSFQPTRSAKPLTEELSQREQKVLELLAKGSAYKQIAMEMGISMGTINTYIRRIYEKLHVNCRTDAVVKFLRSAK